MAKHKNEEAFYARLNQLAETNKPSVKESRTLGTLIGVERAADGVAYGIIKEQHQYYIKKAGLKENPNVADFAYIGGLENITEHQYPTLASAEKNRNMMFQTINEANSLRPNPNGSKKKIMLTEDKAGEEIAMADEKVGELDAATDAAAADAAPAPEVPADGGDGMPIEPDAGGEAGTDDMLDASGAGDELPDGGIGDVTVPDEEGMDAPVDDAGIEGAPEEDEGTTELQKSVSGVAKEIQDAELDKGEIKWLLDRFLSAFLPVEGEGAGVSETLTEGEEEIAVDAPVDAPIEEPAAEVPAEEPVDVPAEGGGDDNKMAALDIEDRQELADKILKVVPDEEQAAVADTIPQDGIEEDGLDVNALDVAMEEGGDECTECGGFAQYADSRGHDADSMMGADDEEMSNVISGYANAHADGQNDGDFKAVALFITPEILEKLKGDYGHDDFANQVEPFANEMNECGLEEKEAQINEMFGNLGRMAKGAAGKVAGDVVGGVKGIGKNIAQKAGQVQQAVGDYATGVKQAAHSAVVPQEVKKLEGVAAKLGQQIDALNKRLEKAGKEPVKIKSILRTIANQVSGAARTADLSGKIAEDGSIAIEEPIDNTGIEKPVNEEGSIAIEEPIDNTGIEKPVNEEGSIAIEEPIDNTGIEKLVNEIVEIAEAGIPADSVEAAPNQFDEEESAEDITNPDGDAPVEDVPEIDAEVPAEEPHVEPDGDEGPAATNIVGGFESMGGGVVKPDGPAPVVVEIDATENKVNVTMNEGEKKVRDYIRQQIKEQLGIEKSNLNEDQKSKKLQKVDKIIAEQLKLYESANIDEMLNVPYSLSGKLAKTDPNDEAGIERLFAKTFHNALLGPEMAAISRVVQATPIANKLEILNQYAQGGGTLGLNDQNVLILQPKAV